MRQLKLFLILFAIGASLASCKKEDNESNKNNKNNVAVLPTKIIKTDVEGQKTTRLYEYDGTKIKKITETSNKGSTVFSYTYTGDNISKIVEQNEDGMVKNLSFIYADDKLMMWSENYDTDSETCFACEISVIIDYNTDGSQTVKYYIGKDLIGKDTKWNEVKVINEPASNKLIEASARDATFHVFTFDGNIPNPHKNITGWTKLERLNPVMHAEVNVKEYIHSRSVNINNVINGWNAQFLYRPDSFPTEAEIYDIGKRVVAPALQKINSNPLIYKEQYFYNK